LFSRKLFFENFSILKIIYFVQKPLRDYDICFGIGDIEKELAKKNWGGMVSKKGDWLACDE
jgi:hypothetical protein